VKSNATGSDPIYADVDDIDSRSGKIITRADDVEGPAIVVRYATTDSLNEPITR